MWTEKIPSIVCCCTFCRPVLAVFSFLICQSASAVIWMPTIYSVTHPEQRWGVRCQECCQTSPLSSFQTHWVIHVQQEPSLQSLWLLLCRAINSCGDFSLLLTVVECDWQFIYFSSSFLMLPCHTSTLMKREIFMCQLHVIVPHRFVMHSYKIGPVWQVNEYISTLFWIELCKSE